MWDLRSKVFTTKQLRCLHILAMDPLIMLLFLAKFPKRLYKQILYFTKWVIMSTLVEWVAHKKLQVLYFDHGWNIGWSLLIYVKMYLYSLLLKKNAILTMILSIFSTLFFLIKFKVPVKRNIVLQLEKGRDFINARINFNFLKLNTLLAAGVAILIGIRTLQKIVGRV